jgi:hypothetical protein
MKKAVEWLGRVEADLLTASAMRTRQETSPQPPAKGATVPPMLLKDLPALARSKDPLAMVPVTSYRDQLSSISKELAVTPALPPPLPASSVSQSPKQFLLLQGVMMAKVEVSLAFDGSSSTVVSVEYTNQMKLKEGW